ncbi:MAG: permease of the major facilitator superfamily [Deltaproteobacteria bacterium]|nr:permease of the major facilitator superfamily [Deltaproteobacteria bacterium]
MKSAKFYYGWVIVGLAMISMSFWFGVRSTFSVFFVALIDHFQWSRAEAAGAQSIAMLVYMIMAPIIGTLVDRIGPRKTILPGIFLLGLGFLLCTQIRSLFQFYLFFGVIVGVGVTCLSIAPFTVLLAHWFEHRRGTANGLASIGIGTGILFFVPLMQYLISVKGWQFAYLIFGFLVLMIPLPLSAFFLRHTPKELGLLPDGETLKRIEETDLKKVAETGMVGLPSKRDEMSYQDILKNPRFWGLLLFPSLVSFGAYFIIVHHVKYLTDLGVDRSWAASLFAGIGALSGGFRFFWGWLSDRTGREIAFTLGMVCFTLGVLFLLLFETFRITPILYLFAACFGSGWGATAPLFMSIAADLYKGRNFGWIYGTLEGVLGIGAALGAYVGGAIFDRTGSYFWGFILIMIFNLISIPLVWLVAPRKFRRIGYLSQ